MTSAYVYIRKQVQNIIDEKGADVRRQICPAFERIRAEPLDSVSLTLFLRALIAG